jgi:hypothetical protein
MMTQPELYQEMPEPNEALLGRACELLRQSRLQADLAMIPLVVVATGVVGRMGGPLPGLLRGVLLAATAVGFLGALYWIVRSRRTVSTALGDLRSRMGAPVQRVPWKAVGIDRPLGKDVLGRELRSLLGAAYACSRYSESAVAWSVVTLVLYLFTWR